MVIIVFRYSPWSKNRRKKWKEMDFKWYQQLSQIEGKVFACNKRSKKVKIATENSRR